MDREILALNQRGLIPGPGESEEHFLQRAHSCLAVKEWGRELGLGPAHEQFQERATALSRAREWYDIAPDWVPVHIHNQGLMPWHGGCAWVDAKEGKALIQLRKGWIGDRTELLCHEMAHVGRMAFEEPKFEELIAYRSSSQRLRRLCGGAVQNPWEAALFVALCAGALGVSLASFRITLPSWLLPLSQAAPLLFGSVGVGRALFYHRQMVRCLAKLQGITAHPSAVLYRLSDQEILHFASSSAQEILRHAAEQSSEELRWRVLSFAYFATGHAHLPEKRREAYKPIET